MQVKQATWFFFEHAYLVGSSLQVFHIFSLLQAEKIASPEETFPQEPVFKGLFVVIWIFHK